MNSARRPLNTLVPNFTLPGITIRESEGLNVPEGLRHLESRLAAVRGSRFAEVYCPGVRWLCEEEGK